MNWKKLLTYIMAFSVPIGILCFGFWLAVYEMNNGASDLEAVVIILLTLGITGVILEEM